MLMTRDEVLAYSRGYNAGSKKQWPPHKPPYPPNEQVKAIMKAARALRNEIDGEIATLCEDDSLVLRTKSLIDDVDDALETVGRWLIGQSVESSE